MWRDDSRARRRRGVALWDGSVRAQLEGTSRHSSASADADAELRVNFLSTGNRLGRRGPDELLASERAERGDRAAAEGDGSTESLYAETRGAIARKWARAVTGRGHELESHIEVSVEGSDVRVTLELSLGALDALVRVHGGIVARAPTAAPTAAACGDDALVSFSKKRYPLPLLLAQAWGANAVAAAAERAALDSVGHAWARATHEATAQAHERTPPRPPRVRADLGGSPLLDAAAARSNDTRDSDTDGAASAGAGAAQQERAARMRADTDRVPATLLPVRGEERRDSAANGASGPASSSPAKTAATKTAAGEGHRLAAGLEVLPPAQRAAAGADAAPDATAVPPPHWVMPLADPASLFRPVETAATADVESGSGAVKECWCAGTADGFNVRSARYLENRSK